MILIYVTHENEMKAKELSDILLSEKIVACYNIFPIEAIYWWKWEITSAGEIVSLLKTTQDYWEKVKKRVWELHPYEIPCILKIEVETNESYEKWINEQISH
jgi:periplasmic divalent cation tolerance protein